MDTFDPGAGAAAALDADPPVDAADESWGYSTLLAISAGAYAVFHHVGSLPSGLGPAGNGTRWADWIDLVTPFAVLVPAAMALRDARARAPLWALFAVGGLAYAEGHGLHLAANSVGNAAPGETAHLWDELVGHYIWYLGAALVTAALALTMRYRPRATHPAAYALAVAAGITWATNSIGSDALPLGLLVALGAIAFGWRHRRGLPVLLAVGYAPGAILITAYLSGAVSQAR
jgi:hypothetical protein